jgi:signal transduction histidine kinase
MGETTPDSSNLGGTSKYTQAEDRLKDSITQERQYIEDTDRDLTHEGWEAYLDSPSAPNRAYTFNQNQIIAIDTTDLEPYSDINNAMAVQTQSLRVRDQDIGHITIMEPDRDQETVENLMSIVAERLSVHIDNLRLLDETEHSRQQLDKRAKELETVAQVSTAAATILEPIALLQSVVNLTSYSFNLYHASVYLLNETGDLLELAATSEKIGQTNLEYKHKIGIYEEGSIIAKAARRRESIIVSDTRIQPEIIPLELFPDALSKISIPLIVGEQLIGVFDVEADTAGRFTEEDIRIFTTLASQTAIALRNAQLYEEQMKTVERLRELDRLKSSFLANMSHELRTPLNSILGFTQVILEGLDGPLTEDMEMDLGLIEKNGQHLLRLINEVLDMAKIESGRISLGLEPVNLLEMLRDVISTSSPLVKGDVKLVNACQTPEDMFIMADSVRLRQMLLNIIGNALKFTEQGNVSIETELYDEKVQIRVVDTGIGIPPDKLESIFEAFSQVDTSTTRKAGGTGLGLPISRRLAEMHGGWLWAKSNGISGEGSTFYLDLPIDDSKSMKIQ